ncbi:MAG: C39 family peptidase [Kamptonema sp. SIO1D9]|nr:C39 family peptidase [Kamptonema sp. SIO1D9]
MTNLEIIKPTIFKQQPIQHVDLDFSEKLNLGEDWLGSVFPVDFHSLEANHYKVDFGQLKLAGRSTWYAYCDHVRLIGEQKTAVGAEINLPVPHFSQRDNRFDPHRTCNITCVAMVLAFYGIKPKRNEQLEDELFLEMQRQGKNIIWHEHLSQLIKSYGFKNSFKVDATWEEVKAHLRAGNPVIQSGRYTKSGHIIVIRGYSESKRCWYVNDPWGEWFSTGYSKGLRDGENQEYSYNLLSRLSMVNGRTWAHFPSRYNGK